MPLTSVHAAGILDNPNWICVLPPDLYHVIHYDETDGGDNLLVVFNNDDEKAILELPVGTERVDTDDGRLYFNAESGETLRLVIAQVLTEVPAQPAHLAVER